MPGYYNDYEPEAFENGRNKPDLSEPSLSNAMDTPEPRNAPMLEMSTLAEARTSLNMADLGTRYQHYSELAIYWENKLALMGMRGFLGRDELLKRAAWSLALKGLRLTMQLLPGYNEMVGDLKAMINEIPPKGNLVFGGRGTPLPPWEPGKDDEGIV